MLRYSMRTMLAAVCAVAVFFALLRTAPAWFGVPVLWLFTLLLPPALAGFAYYGHGYARAFAIGGVMTAAPMVFAITQVHGISSGLFEAVFTNQLSEEPVGWLKTVFAVTWITTGLSGLATVGVRWLTARETVAVDAAANATTASDGTAAEPHFLPGRIDVPQPRP